MNQDYASAYWPEVLAGNGYEQEYYEPVNLAWQDKLIAENMARQVAKKVPKPLTELYRVQGGRVGKSRSTASLEMVPKPIAMPRRYGLQAIIRIANEMEFALNYFQHESDIEMLLTMEPHLRRVDQITRQLTRAATKAHRQSDREYSLFEE